MRRGRGISRRRLRHHAVRRHVLCKPDIAANRRVAPDRDPAEDGGAGVNDHVVFHDGVTGVALDHIALIVSREMPRAERDGLINSHIVANDGGFADDDAGAVINEEARSDRGPRMNVDAGPGMRDLRHQPGHQSRVLAMQEMR